MPTMTPEEWYEMTQARGDALAPGLPKTHKELCTFYHAGAAYKLYLWGIGKPRVHKLVMKMSKDNMFSSNPHICFEHPLSQRLLDMKDLAIRDLILFLDECPIECIAFLHRMTEENPTHPDDAGRVMIMIDNWKRWGLELGIISEEEYNDTREQE